MPKLTELGYLIRFDPPTAKAKILAALETSDYWAAKAALSLGVTRLTLTRWIKELGMKVDLRQGRPPKN